MSITATRPPAPCPRSPSGRAERRPDGGAPVHGPGDGRRHLGAAAGVELRHALLDEARRGGRLGAAGPERFADALLGVESYALFVVRREWARDDGAGFAERVLAAEP